MSTRTTLRNQQQTSSWLKKEAFLASCHTSSPQPPPPPKKGELAKKAYKFFSRLSKFIRRSEQLPEASGEALLVAALGNASLREIFRAVPPILQP